MKILILGGTQFVGRAMAEATLARGHELTLFNRGKTGSDLFPAAEKLVGDRDGGLDALDGGSWDAVIDTCGYFPRLVKDSVQKLQGAVQTYAFVSTISVFADNSQFGNTEESPMGEDVGDGKEEFSGEKYGPFKTLCENEVKAGFEYNNLIIRPGLVTGPNDPTNRFGYWPARIAKGGDVLIPGKPERPLQHIDARDLADFTLNCLESGQMGDFNATGPEPVQTMADVVEACLEASGSGANPIYVDEAFLLENEVQPWSELPFWIPESMTDTIGLFQYNIQKALDAGLVFRPLRETVADALAFENERAKSPDFHNWASTLASEKEQAVLEKWANR